MNYIQSLCYFVFLLSLNLFANKNLIYFTIPAVYCSIVFPMIFMLWCAQTIAGMKFQSKYKSNLQFFYILETKSIFLIIYFNKLWNIIICEIKIDYL
jgi:hypothetical protein